MLEEKTSGTHRSGSTAGVVVVAAVGSADRRGRPSGEAIAAQLFAACAQERCVGPVSAFAPLNPTVSLLETFSAIICCETCGSGRAEETYHRPCPSDWGDGLSSCFETPLFTLSGWSGAAPSPSHSKPSVFLPHTVERLWLAQREPDRL